MQSLMDKFFILITMSQDPMPQVILGIIAFICLYFYFDKRVEAVFFEFNIGLVGVTNLVLKELCKESRPTGKWLVEAHGYGFPSGHSSLSLAMYILLVYFMIKFNKNRKNTCLVSRTSIISSVLFIYILLIGYSRLHVGVHYRIDVIGGWALAIMGSFITIKLYELSIKKGYFKWLNKINFIKKSNESGDI